ncbi:MAG: methyl-accepting chemotaxis protein [Thermodesulfovibrionales bacterium]
MSLLQIALIILVILSAVLNVFLLLRRRTGEFNKFLHTFLAKNMAGRINLVNTLEKTETGDHRQGEIISFFNEFILKLRQILKNSFSIGHNLTTTSDAMKKDASELLQMADSTSMQSTQVATAMEEMSSTINEIARKASAVATSSVATLDNASQAETDIKKNVKSIELLSGNVSNWAETNRALSHATRKIDEIILVINDIADQTNLLALNAAIEAARAGEQGRGFAVVADEVRKLADKTGKATKEIGGMIRDVKSKADNSLGTMDSTLAGVTESIQRSRSAEESLIKIVTEVRQITDMIQQIATASEEQSKVSEDVVSNMEKVANYANQTKMLAQNISTSGDSVASLAINLYSNLCNLKKDNFDTAMEELLISCSSSFQSMLEEAVRTGRLENSALFDDNYVKVDEEGRFSTGCMSFFENSVLSSLKQWAQADKKIVYVVAMDRNGYMPTHIMPARARLKMADPISINGAKSEKLIGQAFRRPIAAGGELVIDITHPILPGGRHWGCLRIGYMPDMS